MTNAWINYHENKNKEMSLLDFRMKVVEGLSNIQIEEKNQNLFMKKHRLHGMHFIRKIEGGKKRDCKVCSNAKEKNRVTTTYECEICEVSLCPVDCFKLYHTFKKYK